MTLNRKIKKIKKLRTYARKYNIKKITKKIILYGGAKRAAETLFKIHFESIKDSLLSDADFLTYLKGNKFNSVQLFKDNPLYETVKSELFNLVINKLKEITPDRLPKTFVDDYIEWIMNCYVNSNFSIHNLNNHEFRESTSLFNNYRFFLELFERLEYIIKNKKILINIFLLKKKEHLDSNDTLREKERKLIEVSGIIDHNKAKPEKLITPFNSLAELKEFIDYFRSEYSDIETELQNEQLKKKFNKEKDVEIVLETDNVAIYKILTKTGSLFCGSGTSWCTATTSFFNKFDLYNKLGYLYVIQDKHSKKKYQMHIVEGQLRDDKDKKVSISNVLASLKSDEKLAAYFQELSRDFPTKPKLDLYQFFERNPTLIFTIRSLYYDYIYSDLASNNFIELFKNYISNIRYEIKTLIFDELFNQELGDALTNGLESLETLKFGASFNQDFGNSLDNLHSLKHIILSTTYDKPIPVSITDRGIEIKNES